MSVNTQPIVVFASNPSITVSPILNSVSSIVIPLSSDATATLIFDVASGPYGLQFDKILNHAYKQGRIDKPMTITTATTFVFILLKSDIKIRKMFNISNLPYPFSCLFSSLSSYRPCSRISVLRKICQNLSPHLSLPLFLPAMPHPA